MREDYSLLTPENVELRFEVAGVGSRVAAVLIDYLIILVSYFVLYLGGVFAVAFVVGFVTSLADVLLGRQVETAGLGDVLGYVILALIVLLTFLGWWGYFILFEQLWNGQTIGKRRLGLRVVRQGGQAVSLTSSIQRNLLRIVDDILFIGVLVALIDGQSRRLGDFAAGTLVIREPRLSGRGKGARGLAAVELPPADPHQVESLSNADKLTMAQYAIIRDYFARRSRLSDRQSAVLAGQLAARFAETLGVASAEVGDPVAFLGTVARAFEARQTREY